MLLAHENARLRHRHDLYRLLPDLGTAANPLLRPLSAAVRRGIERWADEEAARVVGDRRLVARAVARAGLAQVVQPRDGAACGGRLPQSALGLSDSHLRARTEALLLPVPPSPRLLIAGTMLTIAVVIAVSLVLGRQTQQRLRAGRGRYASLARPAPQAAR